MKGTPVRLATGLRTPKVAPGGCGGWWVLLQGAPKLCSWPRVCEHQVYQSGAYQLPVGSSCGGSPVFQPPP